MSCKIAHITDLHWRQAIDGTSGDYNRKSRLMPLAFSDALNKMKTQGVEVIALTGDLLDVPEEELTKSSLLQVVEDYQSIKKALDDSGLEYVCIPGNHDHLDSFFNVFGKERIKEAFGYEFISFYDHVPWPEPVERQGEEANAFNDALSRPGQRNQIHLQHYIIHSKEFEDSIITYQDKPEVSLTDQQKTQRPKSIMNHAYADSTDLLGKIKNSSRVKLLLSGHYHSGCQLAQWGEVHSHTGPSFSEEAFTYVLLDLSENEVTATTVDMKEEINSSSIDSPYELRGQWLKGGLHTHCKESSGCAHTPLADGVEMYSRKNYNFLAITDHDTITPIDDVKNKYPDITFFEGYEHSVSNHMLFISEKAKPHYEIEDKKEALKQAADELTIICHPQGPKADYWTKEELKDYPVLPTGVEVFNGHYGAPGWRTAGAGWDYTDFWVGCLDEGIKLLAYANDDFHEHQKDFSNGWNMVFAPGRTPSKVLGALKKGSCYGTTGLTILSLHEYRGRIVVNFEEEVKGSFFGPGQDILMSKRAKSFEFDHSNEAYLRFEAEKNGRKCWTQAFHAKG